MIHPGERILVAVSGGPDSICLAHALYVLGKRWGLSLHFIHVHHGLRPDADKDARLVRRLGNKLEVPTTIRRANVFKRAQKTRRGLEDAGRRVRYGIFEEEARRLKIGKIATAHHLDDHAETVLLHLLRGTHPRGLAGIPVKRPLHELKTKRSKFKKMEVIRPLLCFKKSEILQYLKFWRLRYRRDSTNGDTRLLRNWVRLKLIPLLESKNPKIREHLRLLSRNHFSISLSGSARVSYSLDPHPSLSLKGEGGIKGSSSLPSPFRERVSAGRVRVFPTSARSE